MTVRRLPRGLSRRSFLAGSAAFGAATLTGCATGSSGSREVDLGSLNDLTIHTWSDYVDPSDAGVAGTVALASDELGLNLQYLELWEDNTTGYVVIESDLAAGRVPSFSYYLGPDGVPSLDAINEVQPSEAAPDIVVPTNWLAGRMVQQGYAEPIPIELIPNHSNLDPAFLTMDWDRGARFHMPWQSGITGIAWDPDAIAEPIDSVKALFDPQYQGRVGMIGEMREAVGLAMLALPEPADPGRPTEATAQAGLDLLLEAHGRGQFAAWYFDEFTELLLAGEVALTMAWSGDTLLLQDTMPSVQFVVPQEGAIQWFDTMVIPKNAANLGAAARWMNYVYDPVNAARITGYVGYVSPVLGVQEELLASGDEFLEGLAANPLVFPDADTKTRLFTWGTLDAAVEDRLQAEFDAAFF